MQRGLLSLAVLACACASTSAAHRPDESDGGAAGEWAASPTQQRGAPSARSPVGGRIASRAARLVGLGSLKKVTTQVPDDCSGLIRYLYDAEGVDLMEPMRGTTNNASAAIWGAALAAKAVASGRLEPGDL